LLKLRVGFAKRSESARGGIFGQKEVSRRQRKRQGKNQATGKLIAIRSTKVLMPSELAFDLMGGGRMKRMRISLNQENQHKKGEEKREGKARLIYAKEEYQVGTTKSRQVKKKIR